MTHLYSAYKSVRNLTRDFNYYDSLEQVWIYMQHLAASPRRQLPLGYGPTVSTLMPYRIPPHVLPPHHLDLALRELLIHANPKPLGRRSLARWNDLASLINVVKEHGELAAEAAGEQTIYDTLHRLGHQQLPWQTSVLKRDMVRMWIMMQAPEVRHRAESTIGMSVEQYFFMAFASIARTNGNWAWGRLPSYALYGIRDDAASALYSRLSDTPAGHREAQIAEQLHAAEWEYSWNPLQRRPLIHLPTQSGMDYACPAPLHLHRRLFSGLFYDLVGTPGFPEALGDAYDALTGLTLQRGYPGLNAAKPDMYPGPKGVLHHGTDWQGCDGSANVFIECKAKRMAAAAKVLSDPDVLVREITALARAVVQNYRNIQEALDGRTAWMPDELPIYSIIVTLEDWILFSPTSRHILAAAIDEQMQAEGLDISLLTRAPYTICCAYELEELVFAWADHNVHAVMAAKHSGECDRWMVCAFLRDRYAGTHSRAHDLFTPESDILHREIMRIGALGVPTG